MASALPDGFVSVPAEQSVGYAIVLQVQIRALTGVSAYMNGWQYVGNSFSGGTRRFDIIEPDGTPHFGTSFFDPSMVAPWSPWLDFAEIGAGYRKGRKLQLVDSPGTPLYGQRDWRRVERWFADAGTSVVQTVGAFSHTQTFADPPSLVGPVIGILDWRSRSGPFQQPWNYPLVKWRAMAVSGWDAGTITQLDNGHVHGTGSGAAELYQGSGVDTAQFIAPPFKFDLDGVVDKFGVLVPDWAQMLDTFYCIGIHAVPYISVPAYNGAVVAQNVSWPLALPYRTFGTFGPGAFGVGPHLHYRLEPGWMAAQDPPLEGGDQYVGIDSPCGLDPSGSPSRYQPVGLAVETGVELHRPDGNKPSSWVSLDTGLGTVVDGATDVVFTVTGAGASFRRTLDTTWRVLANYRDTDHEVGHDVYWMPTFPFMQLHWEGSNDVGIVLKARGVHYDEAGAAEHAFEFDYPVSLVGGASDPFVDLLMGSGAEGYPTRVDDWTLVLDTPGNYTLSEMKLVARLDLPTPGGVCHCKVLPTVPEGLADCNEVVISLDGGSVLDCLPPLTTAKANESIPEVYGGAPQHILSDMLTLHDFWLGQLDGIEGAAIPTYDVAVYEGKNKDAYGVVYGPEQADWLAPNPPAELVVAGTTWHPWVRPLVAELSLCNHGASSAVKIRWSLWGALEGTVRDGHGRAAAGTVVPVYRRDTHTLVGTGVTDLLGYALLYPLPANSSLLLAGTP